MSLMVNSTNTKERYKVVVHMAMEWERALVIQISPSLAYSDLTNPLVSVSPSIEIDINMKE